MNKYKVLNKTEFKIDNFTLVPIRYEDRWDIMKWRNEQIYHLRQPEPLNNQNQEDYFNNVIGKLFDQDHPAQILFSYLENDKCIGYGGLVHINWVDKNAEISFLMATELEEYSFQKHWINFLKLIEQVAFNEICIHKIYTYAFDLRPHFYDVMEEAGYIKEVRLKEHCFFQGKYIDVLIHSKIHRC